jgi:hypothetical protein
MVFEFRMASILSVVKGILPPPSGRIAAGRLCLSTIFPENAVSAFPVRALAHDRLSEIESPLFKRKIMRKRAQTAARVNS